MNSPSAVSITAIPAANRIGRVSNAYQGSPAAAPVPAERQEGDRWRNCPNRN